MAIFRECYICGATLDSGEKCDCQEEKRQKERFWKKRVNVSAKDGQGSFVFESEREVV